MQTGLLRAVCLPCFDCLNKFVATVFTVTCKTVFQNWHGIARAMASTGKHWKDYTTNNKAGERERERVRERNI